LACDQKERRIEPNPLLERIQNGSFEAGNAVVFMRERHEIR